MAAILETASNSISSKQRALKRLPTWLPGVHSKPNCSYNCLIGLALKNSKRKSLPVNEIYTFFLNEFPYFRNSAPDGWKNSIRHSLSLGPYFRKTQVAGFQGKKGFQWEVIPDKLPVLEQEIAKFLAGEEKLPHHCNNPDITRMKITSPTSQHHDSVYCSVITASSSEKIKFQCKKAEPSILPKEDNIVGIFAYLKDAAPQRKSAGLTTTTYLINKPRKDLSAKGASNTITTTPDILKLPVNTTNNRPSQAKITHSDSSVQHDCGKGLNLELVDEIGTSGNEGLISPLIVDSLGLKRSLTEVNWSIHAYKNKSHAHKHVDTKSSPKKCLAGFTIRDWLEPANDWNQWKQPAYVERMISLSSSLQSNSNDSVNEIPDALEITAADCTSITEKSKRSKLHRCLGKRNYMTLCKKGVKYCNRKRSIIVSDKKISDSAATWSTSQSNVPMDKCCTDKTTYEHLEQIGKCLTFQLMVSISFDHLQTIPI